MNSIATQDLAVAYEGNLMADDLDMQIPQGRITTTIGSNGCGEFAVLKAVSRILKPKGDVVYLNGDDIRRLTTRKMTQKVAILPQSPQVPAESTMGELMAYGCFPHQRGFGKLVPEDKRIIQWALEVIRLTEFGTTTVGNLLGGQRRRVWIAATLTQQTDLILLDEPTTYLSPTYQPEVFELLCRLNREQGCTIVMVLHDLNPAARFTDYMITVRGEDIIWYGMPEEVVAAEVFEEALHIGTEIIRELRTGRPTYISYDLIRQAQGTTGIYKKVNQ